MHSSEEAVNVADRTEQTEHKSGEEVEQSEGDDVNIRSMRYPGSYRYKPRSRFYKFTKDILSYKLFILICLLLICLFSKESIISFYTTNIFDRNNFVYFTSSHKIFFKKKKLLIFLFWSYFAVVILEAIIYFTTEILVKYCERLYNFFSTLNALCFHIAVSIVIFTLFLFANNINFYISDVSFLQLIFVIFFCILLLAILKITFKELSSNLIDRNCTNNMFDCILLEGFLKVFKSLKMNSNKLKVFSKINHHLSCLPPDFHYFSTENINQKTKSKIHKYFIKDFFFSSFSELKEDDLLLKHFAYKTFIDFCKNNLGDVLLTFDRAREVNINDYSITPQNEIMFVTSEERMTCVSEPNFFINKSNDNESDSEELNIITAPFSQRIEILEIIIISNHEALIKYMDSFYLTEIKNLKVQLKTFSQFFKEKFVSKIKKRFNLGKTINVEEFYKLFKYLYKKKINIQNNFNARYVVLRVSYQFLVGMIILFSFLCLYCGFKIEDKDIVSFLYTFTSLANLLRETSTEIFESIINIIFIHPYDVGDVINVNLGKEELICTVKNINVFTTTLLSYDNKEIYFYNTMLKELTILNLHKSTFISTVVVLKIGREFDFYLLERLKKDFISFLEREVYRGYDNSVTIGISDYEEGDKAVLKVFYRINNSNLSYLDIMELRSEALKYLIGLMQDYKLSYKKRALTINFRKVIETNKKE